MAVAATAAWPTATLSWFSALTTSPAAYRPGTVVCWCESTLISPSCVHLAPSATASSERVREPSEG
jgi:hypothetical protein